MKKVFKFLIPIILAAAIVLCLIWYLFVYDRAFTRDVMLYGARYFDRNNKPAAAAWFYDLAYNQSVDSDEVAIELAQQHKQDGNFTQAEVILSQAIVDGGSADLYTALCRTYLEQDKVLDAIKLLDGIADSAIRAEIEAMRPAAPTVSPEPGLYNQYIPVTVSSDSWKTFATINGDYPSVVDDIYLEPLILSDGENLIRAVAVGENGLVSPLASYTFTVGGIIEEVVFADPYVEQAVRQTLNVNDSAKIMSNQLWDITSFAVPVEAISLADLRYMPFLQELVIVNGPSGQLDILSGLSNLTSLSIQNTPVSAEELDIIGTLTSLRRVTLNNCGLSTIEPLACLTELNYLDLGNNTLRNIQVLAGLSGITELKLQHNVLTDLGSLSDLKNLTRLDISYNNLTSLAPIANLTNLTWLDANHNQLDGSAGVGTLTALQYLNLSFNTISDISPLASCTSITELNISNNALSEISAVTQLMNMVKLNFSNNQVYWLPEFANDCALVTIDGSYNKIQTLEPLAGMEALNGVYMDYNEDLSSVEWLATCPTLIVVNVYGTKVTEVKSLTDQSIIVNFNPTQSDSLL